MAGGEFRFGTASIYMAQRDNIQPNRTSQMRVITWTRFRRPQRHFLSTSAAFIVSARGKLGLAHRLRRLVTEDFYVCTACRYAVTVPIADISRQRKGRLKAPFPDILNCLCVGCPNVVTA